MTIKTVRMYRKINYSDHLEKKVGETLQDCGIEFTHDSEVPYKQLDFNLTNSNIHIEIKQYHSDRIAKQMGQFNNVIALQGAKSVQFFCDLLSRNKPILSEMEQNIQNALINGEGEE